MHGHDWPGRCGRAEASMLQEPRAAGGGGGAGWELAKQGAAEPGSLRSLGWFRE